MRRALVLGALLALVLAASSGVGKSSHPVSKPRWLAGVRITEYYSAPENWFVGRKVSAPGIPGKHRVDWLYSAGGVSMEGDGIGLDGLHYHLSAIGTPGWVTEDGIATAPGASGWTGGSPFWRFGWYLPSSHASPPSTDQRSESGPDITKPSSADDRRYRAPADQPGRPR